MEAILYAKHTENEGHVYYSFTILLEKRSLAGVIIFDKKNPHGHKRPNFVAEAKNFLNEMLLKEKSEGIQFYPKKYNLKRQEKVLYSLKFKKIDKFKYKLP